MVCELKNQLKSSPGSPFYEMSYNCNLNFFFDAGGTDVLRSLTLFFLSFHIIFEKSFCKSELFINFVDRRVLRTNQQEIIILYIP